MHYEIITSCNVELHRKYAQKSMRTWTTDPVIYWQESQQHRDPRWDMWRTAARMRETGRFAQECVRFSHKVQAQIQHIRSSSADYVIWLDADVVQHSDYTPQQFAALMPAETELFTFLDRQPYKYAETGWIAYNMRHPRLKEFVNRLEDIYMTRELFSLEQFHDAFVWDHVRRRGNYPARNLLHNPRSSEPFDDSDLAPYFRHHKGQRKATIK
jgi:hypothetical protein